MKTHILSLFLLAALAMTSCNDRIDLRSNGTTTMSEVFKDRNMTRGYLNGCYNSVLEGGVAYSIYAAAFSDDAQHSQDNTAGTRYDYWYNQGTTSSNFGAYNLDGNPWASYFQGVRRCNIFLANIDAATDAISAGEKAGWKAQAYTLRAWFYLQLMKRYGQVPLFVEDLGMTHDYSSDRKASIGEVTTQILSDCDAAISTANSEDFSYVIIDKQFGMVTKALAQAIRAEAVMYAVSPLFNDGTYTKEQAAAIAADALKNILENGYSLWTEASGDYSAYASYFLSDPSNRSTDKESIFSIWGRASVWTDCGVPILGGQVSAGSCPTQELVDAYEMSNGQPAITGYSDASHLKPIINAASGYDERNPYKDRDPRFYATVFYNGSMRGKDAIYTYSGANCGLNLANVRYTHTGYYMRKYAHNASNRNSNSDGYVRIVRLAEVYYNFAEVAYQAFGPDAKVAGINLSAREAVNIVRARAGMPGLPAGLSAAEFESRYRNERRIEFAMEADRYFCLRRWKILTEKTRIVSGMNVAKTGDSYTYSRFAFEERPTSAEKYLLYPIELNEATKIKNLTGTSWQNPGWE